MYWYTYAIAPVLVAIFWTYTSIITQRFPTLRGKRILLLIAHPDDEAMFFGPTLLALTKPELGNHIKILCLSSGDADGLGEVRKKELEQSASVLGLRSKNDVLIIEDQNFPDSMTAKWKPKLISDVLTTLFAPKMSTLPPKEAPQTNIDVLLTFDATGVSNHPNHQSLYHGSMAFAKSIMSRHTGWEPPVTLYTLTTTRLWRKYLSIFDAPFTLITCVLGRKERTHVPTPLLFVSGIGEWRVAQKAMTTAHKSQMRWFRWGWIGASRYMVLNDLKKVRVK